MARSIHKTQTTDGR